MPKTSRSGPYKRSGNLKTIQKAVYTLFRRAFGITPIKHRLNDVLGEAMELFRSYDIANIREESGDLLASLLVLIEECGWDAEELLAENMAKIERRMPQYLAMSRKTKVALLGGAFDPIHKGHIEAAQFVLNASRTFDEVWLMPCNRHMYGKEMVSAEHRLAMCELASRVDGRIKVFPYEIEKQLAGETYSLVQRLLAEDFAKDQYDFSIIMGMDNAKTFSDWVNSEYLETMMRFIVVGRQGYQPDVGAWYLKEPHICMVNEAKPIMDVSSTQVRELLRAGDPAVEKYVDPLALDYIRQNKLYV